MNDPLFLAGSLLGSAVLIMASAWLVRYVRGTADERSIKAIVRRHADACLTDAVLSDGLSGYLFADYLLLLRGSVIAMNVLRLDGHIFGAEKIDQWTQVTNKKSYKFPNPLHNVRMFARQAAHLTEGVDVKALVLFGRKSSFPKGVPAGVLRLESLTAEFGAMAKGAVADDAATEAWERLLAVTAEHKSRYQQENRELKFMRRKGRRNILRNV